MTIEEFLRFLEESDKNTKYTRKIRKEFKEKLVNELCAFIKENYPGKKPVQIPEKLKNQAKWCAIFALESIEDAMVAQEKNKPCYISNAKPKVTSKAESEKELQDFLRQIPEKHHAYATRMHWEDYEEVRVHQLFLKGLHDKIKEVLVEFFQDEILELKGDYLRLLDEDTYLLALDPFIDKIYDHLEQ